jgi:ankyrin repeat protein
VAAQYGSFRICELLINAGYNVNAQNFQGNTPLHYAINFFHRKIVNLLIENCADENLRNSKKLTPWEGI